MHGSLLCRPASFSGIHRTRYIEAANDDDLEDKVSYTHNLERFRMEWQKDSQIRQGLVK